MAIFGKRIVTFRLCQSSVTDTYRLCNGNLVTDSYRLCNGNLISWPEWKDRQNRLGIQRVKSDILIFKDAVLPRLKRELERFQSQPPPGISCWLTDDSYRLKASVLGPDDTPYENGLFYVDIHVPERYPFVPPNVRFITPVYHPNIDDSGRICLDILKTPPQGSWKPSLNISSILIAIQLLMAEPNFNDPLMIEIANEYQGNHSSFVKHAREYTIKHAMQQNFSKETCSLKNSADVFNVLPEAKRFKRE